MTDKCIIIILIIAIFCICVSTGLSTTTSTKTITIDVKIKPDQIRDSDGNMYLVQDQVILGEMGASARFQKLKEKTIYDVKMTGIRFPLFNWYPNIVRYKTV